MKDADAGRPDSRPIFFFDIDNCVSVAYSIHRVVLSDVSSCIQRVKSYTTRVRVVHSL